METITSNQNKRIKNIQALKSKSKLRKETHFFIVEGIKMVMEAAALCLLTEAYMTEEMAKNIAEEDLGCECFCVSDKLMKEISDTETPQGILAVCKEATHPPLEEIMARPRLRLLILEDVRDPGNLGTMIRTSEAAGIDAVIMSKGTADMYSPKVIRSTMGSIFRVPCFYTDDLHEVLKSLKAVGIVTYAAHLKGEKFHNEIEYPAKCGVIIGNEANGITEETASLAGELIKIPMEGKVESLNAAIAAAIMMYAMKS